MMKIILLNLFSFLKHLALKGHSRNVSIEPTTRLLRQFTLRFSTPTEDRTYIKVGKECVLNSRIIFEAKTGLVSIGDRCYIGANSSIISRSGVTLGDDVVIAWDVTIYDHDSHSLNWRDRVAAVTHFHNNYGRRDCFETIDWTGVGSAPIKIGDKVWIGFGATILKGVTIGDGAVVGAQSVVTRDVEPYTVVAGNPARVVRKLDEL